MRKLIPLLVALSLGALGMLLLTQPALAKTQTCEEKPGGTEGWPDDFPETVGPSVPSGSASS